MKCMSVALRGLVCTAESSAVPGSTPVSWGGGGVRRDLGSCILCDPPLQHRCILWPLGLSPALGPTSGRHPVLCPFQGAVTSRALCEWNRAERDLLRWTFSRSAAPWDPSKRWCARYLQVRAVCRCPIWSDELRCHLQANGFLTQLAYECKTIQLHLRNSK